MFFYIMLHYTILHLRCLLLRCWLNSRTWQWSGAGMTQGGRAQSISWGFGTRKSKIRWMELILHRLIGGKHPSIYRVSTIRLVMRDFAGPSTVCQKHGLIQLASLIILVGWYIWYDLIWSDMIWYGKYMEILTNGLITDHVYPFLGGWSGWFGELTKWLTWSIMLWFWWVWITMELIDVMDLWMIIHGKSRCRNGITCQTCQVFLLQTVGGVSNQRGQYVRFPFVSKSLKLQTWSAKRIKKVWVSKAWRFMVQQSILKLKNMAAATYALDTYVIPSPPNVSHSDAKSACADCRCQHGCTRCTAHRQTHALRVPYFTRRRLPGMFVRWSEATPIPSKERSEGCWFDSVIFNGIFEFHRISTCQQWWNIFQQELWCRLRSTKHGDAVGYSWTEMGLEIEYM